MIRPGVLSFAAAVALAAVGVYSQNVTANLSGTVTDATGAVIPDATVVIHNNATNADVRTTVTNGDGQYTANLLPYGAYTITVQKPGFRNFVAQDVALHVGDNIKLNAVLQPGAVSQSVEVTASSTPVQTLNAAQSSTITGTQVRELQLNNRNFEQLVTLQPGVAAPFLPAQISFGITNTDNITVNGARGSANNWTVDGSDVNDSGSNLTLLNVPSVDAIQEFSLQRSTYDAQYGRSGGGQVQVVTKSGTSTFQGDAYEFVRNDIFNANDFFSNTAGNRRPPYRYNDFGFTVGGPIFIPHVYNTDKSKTFFFVSEEWRKTRTPSTTIATLPSSAELAGTFTGVQLNPASAPAGCITNNPSANTAQINPSCFSKNAQAYIQNIYSKFSPNGPGGEFINPLNARNDYRQDIVRLDQNIGNRVQVFGRFMQDQVPTTEPGGLFAGNPLPGISSTSTNAPGRNVVAHVTATLSPTIVNEAAFNYSWGAINSNLSGILNSPAFLGSLTNNLPYSDVYGRVPGISISGFTGLAVPVSPYFERNIDKNPYDNLSITRGAHTIRTGISVQWMRKTENAVNPSNGSFSFRRAYGNPAFANFLLGNASTFSQASRDIVPDLRYLDIEAYVQDDWKIRPNLTLNLGVRYSWMPSPTDNAAVLNNFDPLLFNAANAPLIDAASGNFVAGQSVTPASYVNGIIFVKNGCSAAQALAPVTCSPYGREVNPNYAHNFQPRIGFAWDPFGDGKTSIRSGYGMYYDRPLNGIWEQNAFADPPLVKSVLITNTSFDNPAAGTAVTPLGPVGLHATGTPAFKVPYYQNWDFSIEREIANNTRVEIAYVGSKGTHLLGEQDLNQVPVSIRQANPTADVNAVRPFRGYSTITDIASSFDSNYHSLQISANRRVGTGLNFGVAYTWSKLLTDSASDRSNAPYDTYNYRLDYGPSTSNVPQIFVANFVWDLPIFRAQHGVIGHILGGWEASGILTFQTGRSWSIYQFNDPFNSYDWAAGTPGVYPGGIGIDPSPVPNRADLVGSVHGPGTVAEYFNPAAFTDAIGHFGTSGPGIIIGPGTENWDLAGMRNIRFTERINAQFRAELFNAFNHASFNSIDNYVDDSTFGRINGDRGPRTIQLGVKLYW
ncbi:MAG TPA: carboxypeptidase regulatory-like domain-containing protein [Bryobacteraceae bacterium]|nr:carboxypeptidase regulatory-like domain-containing protein [Bryobacteraceae bacterium]